VSVDVAAAPIASKRSVMANRGRWAQIGRINSFPCHGGLGDLVDGLRALMDCNDV